MLYGLIFLELNSKKYNNKSLNKVISCQECFLRQSNTFFCLLLEWSTNPVIVTLDSLNYPTDNIPFPTITICDKENQPSMYAIVAKIMNHVDYICFEDDKRRKVFNPMAASKTV